MGRQIIFYYSLVFIMLKNKTQMHVLLIIASKFQAEISRSIHVGYYLIRCYSLQPHVVVGRSEEV